MTPLGTTRRTKGQRSDARTLGKNIKVNRPITPRLHMTPILDHGVKVLPWDRRPQPSGQPLRQQRNALIGQTGFYISGEIALHTHLINTSQKSSCHRGIGLIFLKNERQLGMTIDWTETDALTFHNSRETTVELTVDCKGHTLYSNCLQRNCSHCCD